MWRVLVSGASGIVGYGVLRSLRRSGLNVFLIGTSKYKDSVAPAFCDLFQLAPPTNTGEYQDWLLTTIRRHHIDMVIPGIEIDMYRWSEFETEIRATGAVPLLNRPELINYCKDKWLFYLHLKQEGLRCTIDSSLTQDYEVLAAEYGLPFLLKPRQGYGSRGIVRVGSEKVFREHVQWMGKTLMAQPIVGHDSEEYTVAAFCDGHGALYASMALRRRLSRDGFTDRAETYDVSPFASALSELCELFRPLGPTNFQFRMCSEGPKLLEINPRISSATSIRTAFGYNESAMALEFFLGDRVPVQPRIRKGKALRYMDEHIFWED